MNPVIDIAVDTETWGTRATFDGRSLGACVFNPYTGQVPDGTEEQNSATTFYVALDNPLMGSYSRDHYTQTDLDMIGGHHRRYNLYRDPKTVEFWHDPKQAEAAKGAFNNPVDLGVGLTKFTDWLTAVHLDHTQDHHATMPFKNIRLWGHGRAFDPPLIESWLHATGLNVPYFYRAPRDSRTCFDMVDIEDHSAWMEKHRVGKLHHGLHDSMTLARAISGAFALRPTWAR